MELSFDDFMDLPLRVIVDIITEESIKKQMFVNWYGVLLHFKLFSEELSKKE